MFTLKDYKADSTIINVNISLPNKERFKYSTKIKIKTSEWSNKKKWIKNPAKNRKNREIDKYLTDIQNIVNTKIYELSNRNDLSKARLKEELDFALGRKERKAPVTFFEFCDIYENEQKELRSYEGYRKIKYVVRLLKKFRDSEGNFDFEDINSSLYNKLLTYMKRNNYSKNYIASIINVWKRILNNAVEKGYTNNLSHREKYFKREEEKIYNIYLSEKELKHLHEFNFSKTPYLDDVTDRFLIGCYTGLRFNDYRSLSKANIQDNDIIVQDMMKEEGRVTVPIHWIVREILEKRDWKLPGTISNQKMNEYLKIMGKKAGIDQEVQKTRTKGNRKTRETFKKYQLITTHTARRSLATNMYLAGIDLYTIMRLTGHSSVTTLLNYIKVTDEDIARKLKKHPFFQKN